MPPRTIEEWNRAASNFRLLPSDEAEIIFRAIFAINQPGCIPVPITPRLDLRRYDPQPFQVWRKHRGGKIYEHRHVVGRKKDSVSYTVGTAWRETHNKLTCSIDQWIDWAWNAEVIRED